MNINQNFFNYVKPYLIKLRETIGDDFVVFGSTPLYLLGVVNFTGKINDLDISVKNLINIPADAKMVTFHGDQDQKFYKIVVDDLEVDIASLWLGQDNLFNKIFDKPIVVGGFKFANLDVVEEWKKEMIVKYDRQKDKDCLQKIQDFRSTQNWPA